MRTAQVLAFAVATTTCGCAAYARSIPSETPSKISNRPAGTTPNLSPLNSSSSSSHDPALLPVSGSGGGAPLIFQSPTSSQDNFLAGGFKVPIQLGVMSQCPDALLCEDVFNEVIKRVGDKLDVSLTYVGKIDDSEPDFGVKCLHGQTECAGNVQQLCVNKYAPSSQNWWEFVQCQNFQGRYKVGLPDVALACAKTASVDWEGSGAGKCAGLDGSGKGEEGVRLLKDSVKLTESLGIQKSCTILINGKKVCVHDETWKECDGGHTINDFVTQINAEYERLNNH